MRNESPETSFVTGNEGLVKGLSAARREALHVYTFTNVFEFLVLGHTGFTMIYILNRFRADIAKLYCGHTFLGWKNPLVYGRDSNLDPSIP